MVEVDLLEGTCAFSDESLEWLLGGLSPLILDPCLDSLRRSFRKVGIIPAELQISNANPKTPPNMQTNLCTSR